MLKSDGIAFIELVELEEDKCLESSQSLFYSLLEFEELEKISRRSLHGQGYKNGLEELVML